MHRTPAQNSQREIRSLPQEGRDPVGCRDQCGALHGYYRFSTESRDPAYPVICMRCPLPQSDMAKCRRFFDKQERTSFIKQRYNYHHHASSIIMHLSSIIMHLSSIIMHLSSIIMHLSSCIYHHASIIMHLSSCIYHHASIIYHHASIIYHHASIIYHLSSCIHHPSSIIHHPSSIIHHPSSII